MAKTAFSAKQTDVEGVAVIINARVLKLSCRQRVMPLTSHGITHTSLLLLLACAQGLNELGIIACLEHYPTIPVTAPSSAHAGLC